MDILLIRCPCLQGSHLTLPICHLQGAINQQATTFNSHNFREVSLLSLSEACLLSTTSTGAMRSLSSSRTKYLLPNQLKMYHQVSKHVVNLPNRMLQRRMHASLQKVHKTMRVNRGGFQSSHLFHSSIKSIKSHSTIIVSVSRQTNSPLLLPLKIYSLIINLILKHKKVLRKCRN